MEKELFIFTFYKNPYEVAIFQMGNTGKTEITCLKLYSWFNYHQSCDLTPHNSSLQSYLYIF